MAQSQDGIQTLKNFSMAPVSKAESFYWTREGRLESLFKPGRHGLTRSGTPDVHRKSVPAADSPIYLL